MSVEKYRASMPIEVLHSWAEEAQDELTQLRAEVAELRKDAERYQWMRLSGNAEIYLHQIPGVDNCKDIGGEYLDAAIDAAIVEMGKDYG